MMSPFVNTMLYTIIGAVAYQWFKTVPDWDTTVAQIWFSFAAILMYKLNLWLSQDS